MKQHLLKLARLPPCSALPIVPLPSISEIPISSILNIVFILSKTSVLFVISEVGLIGV
jgi:hypothetical protein